MSMKTADLIAVRAPKEEDKGFIYKTWMRGLYYGCPFFRDVEAATFYKSYQLVLDELFSTEGMAINVACLKDDEDVVIGYCAYEPSTLHWIYVKKPWRKIGVARMLINFPVKTVTHQTTATRELILKYNFKFNPFRL